MSREGPSCNGLSHDIALNFMELLVAGWLDLYGIKKPEHKDREISMINPLNTELNPICHLLALLVGATIVVVSRLRVKVENKSTS